MPKLNLKLKIIFFILFILPLEALANDIEDNKFKTNTERCTPILDGRNILKDQSFFNQNAWIEVPKGVCDRIKAGDFSDVPKDILAKLDIKAKTPLELSQEIANSKSYSDVNVVEDVKSWLF